MGAGACGSSKAPRNWPRRGVGAARGGVRLRRRHRVRGALRDAPRHIEVQILGDLHGTVVHLFERECSIQRRHQKIIEESPSPRRRRPSAGPSSAPPRSTAARTIGYVNAGTVEFLVLPDGRFAFLEVNTRLQVEHPVTELVTGLDLVRLQLLVADGMAAADRGPRGHGLRPRHRGPALRRGPHAPVPAVGRAPAPLPVPGHRPGAHRQRRRGRVRGLGALRPHAGQGHRPCPDPTEAARAPGRRARAGPGARRDHQSRPAGAHPASPRVPVRRHRHRIPRAPRPRPAGRAPGRALDAEAARRGGRPGRPGPAPGRGRRALGAMPSGWRNNPSAPQHVAFSGPEGRLDVDYRFDRAGRARSWPSTATSAPT